MSAIESRRPASSAGRALVSAVLVVAMGLFGFGVYHAAGLLKASKIRIQRPTDTSGPALPGTMYLVQGGAIYRFAHGGFGQITSENGWMQPSLSPDGSQLVVVKRSLNRSDLYVLRASGRVQLQLTRNNSPSVETNHWAFYPRFSPDASAVYFSYDPKDPYNSYRVDLAIFAVASDTQSARSVQWTDPNQYTGGDVQPIPLLKGGLLYTKYSIDDQSKVHSQVWLQARPGSLGLALTKPEDDCSQPAISKDGTLIAMVCRHGGLQSANLEVATFNLAARTMGAPALLVHSQLVASPAFSPDGKLLAYLAPTEDGGPFQLWTVSSDAASPSSTQQITRNLDLDPTSAPAWAAG
ncbi:MAG TPA: hypothetical protein VLR46_13740 [Candidatus Dormibacteraeota bacterium]|nr:hypothetical protein [Candidatus Dormibacteraeota bacterium]